MYLRKPIFRDFLDVHRQIGSWFLTGQNLYTNPYTYPYMPTGAMFFSLLSLVDRSVGLAMRYTTAIICLWLTCVLFHRMIRIDSKNWLKRISYLCHHGSVSRGQFILYDLIAMVAHIRF